MAASFMTRTGLSNALRKSKRLQPFPRFFGSTAIRPLITGAGKPIAIASEMNYITVLEFIDPQDWNPYERLPNGTIHRRTAKDMLDMTLQQLDTEKGSCILLHDAGGDRSETVKLIPMLITELTKRGYKFVTVSQLINATRDEVNPPVTRSDDLVVANDRAVFEMIYLFELFLSVAFITAIILAYFPQ